MAEIKELAERVKGVELTDPFKIDGPALISFSGGRTSAYMLWRILQAHGGTLPADVVVAFANTGKEREETLDFVQRCAERWKVRVRWLEWRPGKPGFAEVGWSTAARNGEPFEGLIDYRGRLPNPRQRFCSRELKVEPIKALCRSLGWERWANVIGLRHDEGHRCLRKYAENDTGGHRWRNVMPLDKGRVTKRDVLSFWVDHGFDLGLRGYEGNCDLCFLKSRGKLEAIIRDNPGAAAWWIGQERHTGRRFERDRSYEEIARAVADQPVLIDDDLLDEHDAECGDACASEAA